MPPRAFGTAEADPTSWIGPPGLNPMVPADALPVVATARPASRVSMPRRMPHRRSIQAPCFVGCGPDKRADRAHCESFIRFVGLAGGGGEASLGVSNAGDRYRKDK